MGLDFHTPALTTFVNFAPKYLQIITPFQHPLEQFPPFFESGSLCLVLCSCGAQPSPLSFTLVLVKEIGTGLDSWPSLAKAGDNPAFHLWPGMLGSQVQAP